MEWPWRATDHGTREETGPTPFSPALERGLQCHCMNIQDICICPKFSWLQVKGAVDPGTVLQPGAAGHCTGLQAWREWRSHSPSPAAEDAVTSWASASLWPAVCWHKPEVGLSLVSQPPPRLVTVPDAPEAWVSSSKQQGGWAPWSVAWIPLLTFSNCRLSLLPWFNDSLLSILMT